MNATVEVSINPIKIDLKPDITKILEKIGLECSKEISRTAPRRKSGYRDYADSWTYELEKSGETVTVFNDGRDVSLSHLLELGHLTRPSKKGFGKGVQRRVPPQEHIRPAYNQSARNYEELLKKIKIKIGGN